jgi:hypothetical protein
MQNQNWRYRTNFCSQWVNRQLSWNIWSKDSEVFLLFGGKHMVMVMTHGWLSSCARLDRKCSPKAWSLAWYYWKMVEHLKGGAYERSQAIGGAALYRSSLLSLFHFPSPKRRAASFSTHSHHDVLLHYRPKSNRTNWPWIETSKISPSSF